LRGLGTVWDYSRAQRLPAPIGWDDLGCCVLIRFFQITDAGAGRFLPLFFPFFFPPGHDERRAPRVFFQFWGHSRQWSRGIVRAAVSGNCVPQSQDAKICKIPHSARSLGENPAYPCAAAFTRKCRLKPTAVGAHDDLGFEHLENKKQRGTTTPRVAWRPKRPPGENRYQRLPQQQMRVCRRVRRSSKHLGIRTPVPPTRPTRCCHCANGHVFGSSLSVTLLGCRSSKSYTATRNE